MSNVIWRLAVIAMGVSVASLGWSAVPVGRGPNFSYRYAPRTALALDTNALNVGVFFIHELPSFLNCSYIIAASANNPATGTVTYVFLPDNGFVIQNISLFQLATFFSNGEITGEYSTNGGNTFEAFFSTGPRSAVQSFESNINLRGLNATNLMVRYTLLRTSGFNYNVQFLRDCDDNPTSLVVDGNILPKSEADRSVALVPAGAVWKYLDNGSNQGSLWRQLNFDDRSWASGPAELGYGDGDEATTNRFGPDPNNKYITTYYRHAFMVPRASLVQKLTLGLLRDDGGVVYLNGVEIFRSNMPLGPISYKTLASTVVGGLDESTFFQTNVNPAMLVTGTNLLAVEIHQANPTSSDISFNLDLIAVIGAKLDIARNGDCVMVTWTEPDYILEEASDAMGPWREVLGNPASPYTVCGFRTHGYYRLIK